MRVRASPVSAATIREVASRILDGDDEGAILAQVDHQPVPQGRGQGTAVRSAPSWWRARLREPANRRPCAPRCRPRRAREGIGAGGNAALSASAAGPGSHVGCSAARPCSGPGRLRQHGDAGGERGIDGEAGAGSVSRTTSRTPSIRRVSLSSSCSSVPPGCGQRATGDQHAGEELVTGMARRPRTMSAASGASACR